MTHTNPKIAALFMLGQPAEDIAHQIPPIIASEKLNGIRAMWFPPGNRLGFKPGFYSRRGVMFESLTHIKPESEEILDGEIYLPNTPLQLITGAATPNRQEANELTARLQFHVFDLFKSNAFAIRRKSELIHVVGANVVQHHWWLCTHIDEIKHHYECITADGGEGLMLLNPYTTYYSGRTSQLQKLKAFKTMKCSFIGQTEGEGKAAGMMGSIQLYTPNNILFSCGTGFTDAQRKDIFRGDVKCHCIIQYLSLSNEGVPQNPSFLQWA